MKGNKVVIDRYLETGEVVDSLDLSVNYLVKHVREGGTVPLPSNTLMWCKTSDGLGDIIEDTNNNTLLDLKTVSPSQLEYQYLIELNGPRYIEATASGIPNPSNSEYIRSVNLPKLQTVGSTGLYGLKRIGTLNLPRVTAITAENSLSELNKDATLYIPLVEELKSIGNVKNLYGPSVRTIGAILTTNRTIESVDLPILSTLPSNFAWSCETLEYLNIPSVTAIGSGALQNCTSLSNLIAPNVRAISSSGLSNCGLVSIHLPNLTTAADNAFSDSRSLTSLSLPLLTEAFPYLAKGCNSLVNLNLPSLLIIRDYAFEDGAITSFNFSNITIVGGNSFRGTKISEVSIDHEVTLGSTAFRECAQLLSLNLPAQSTIPSSLCWDCSSLVSVDISNATSIASSVFYRCSALEEIIVGTNKTSVCRLSNVNAFEGCTSLTAIYVPDSLVDSYKSATNWSTYADKIKGISTRPTT